MTLSDFTTNHVDEAEALALAAFERERAHVALPEVSQTPGLQSFAGNGMGVAAFEGGAMAGFLCAYPVMNDAFGTTGVTHVYAPPFGHGAAGDNRGCVYQALYAEAARKWTQAGAASHAITLYTHDHTALNTFFRLGFGLRCVDAAMTLTRTVCEIPEGFHFMELHTGETVDLLPLIRALAGHFLDSPLFMAFDGEPSVDPQARYFAAVCGGKYVAYMKVSASGEHFITTDDAMMNITGAFCLPAYRGTGLYRQLLAFVGSIMVEEGFSFLGVDYESYNLAGSGFWEKHFAPYTASVARRIDDKIFNKM